MLRRWKVRIWVDAGGGDYEWEGELETAELGAEIRRLVDEGMHTLEWQLGKVIEVQVRALAEPKAPRQKEASDGSEEPV